MTTSKPIKPDVLSPEYWDAVDREIYVADRATMVDIIRRELLGMIENSKGYLSKTADTLKAWASEDATPEGLGDWLAREGEGWAKVDAAAIEAALVTDAQAALKTSNARMEDCAPFPLDHYWTTSRRDEKTTASYVWTMTAAAGKENPLPPAILAWAAGPVNVRDLYGIDALKDCFAFHGWGPLIAMATERPGGWMRLLLKGWLEYRHKRALTDLNAVGFSIRGKALTRSGNIWTPMPRALDIPSALGGPLNVEFNGETHVAEPDVAAGTLGQSLCPRGVDIVPDEWLGNNAQLYLNLDLNPPAEPLLEYMIETATKTAHLANMPTISLKLLGFMFACAPMTGRGVQGTLGELARWLYPDWVSNRRSARDLRGVGAGFVAIKGLRLEETEQDGTRRPYDLFTMDYAWSANPENRLGWMINPWLVQRMKGGKAGGFFPLNMTRWLAMSIQNPRLFPLALRMGSYYDKARVNGIYEPDRLRPIDADRLAWECNALPPGAILSRLGKTDSEVAKVQLKRARAYLEADLDALKEAGMGGAWEKKKTHGKGFAVLPVPPEEYGEACKRMADAVRKNQKSKGRR